MRDDGLRLLAIHRYYWPDTPPYASLLRAIVAQWTADGHEVEVLTSQPSYKLETDDRARPAREIIDGTTVRRVPMKPDRSSRRRRLLNVIAFPLAAALHILRSSRYDVVMCSTAPPVLLGTFVSWAARRRGAAFVYHCMDLHPEIGALSGEFARPWLYSLLMRLEIAACRRTTLIVVLSEDMRRAVLRRDLSLADRIVVLNNFELPDFARTELFPSPLPAAKPGTIRIVFTGNVGRYQGLETVTQALLEGNGALDRVELVFMGDGGAKADLQTLVSRAPASRQNRVRFVSHGPVSAARALMRSADLGLISLAPGVIAFAYPSKTATYLSEGLPLLVMVERVSALAEMVAAEGVGAVLPPDRRGIQETIAELVIDHDRVDAMAERVDKVWRREFSADCVLPRWSEVPSLAVNKGTT